MTATATAFAASHVDRTGQARESGGRMNAEQWIAAYAERLGTEPPSAEEVEAILELAGEAAHASERIAAPIATWLSAKAGRSLEESLALARTVTDAP
jgi:hypothetical protein